MATRRDVLAGLGGAATLAACGRRIPESRLVAAGAIVGAAQARGHLLREPAAPAPPVATLRCDTLIVGAGIAGLSAAAALDAAGRGDYLLCELADEAGGNAVGGRNAVSSYPWGAHYVPIADPSDEPLCRFFNQLGVIRGFGADGAPVYEETVLCADPDERLWINGLWQEGFLPAIGIGAEDAAQMRRFRAHTEAWRTRRGRDGRPAFSLPLAAGSQDPDIEALDGLTFAAYLDRERYTSRPLRWYLDYCCRDDFGAPASVVSAWAGLHYFAARRGRAQNAAHGDVVTWPEGNAFLARALARGAKGRLRAGWVARSLERTGGAVAIDVLEVATERRVRIEADAAILCVPRHVLERLDPALALQGPAAVHYPWVVANLTLAARPAGIGAPLAWDNVKYQSELLGYVVADHQLLGPPRSPLVVTYYWPISDRAPDEGRRLAAARSHADWCADFLSELYWLHPELVGRVEQLDVWVWGHGMVCPVPGYGTEALRRARAAARPPVFLAHTDLAGLSVFEEAFALGQRAAGERLRYRS